MTASVPPSSSVPSLPPTAYPPLRIGQGIDFHVFAEGRRLVLGGVEIPFARGLLGHSDADVVIHALCDALLGAVALGDIGMHFPNTDPRWKDCDSRVLLREVYRMVRERGWRLVNADLTIVAQKPRIAPHIPQMQNRLARDLDAPPDCVSIKATTPERLGALGREEGIAVWAACLLQKDAS